MFQKYHGLLAQSRRYQTENTMKIIVRNIAIMVVFCATGLTFFTENVRTVQFLGIFASGLAVGASLANMIAALKAKRKTE